MTPARLALSPGIKIGLIDIAAFDGDFFVKIIGCNFTQVINHQLEEFLLTE